MTVGKLTVPCSVDYTKIKIRGIEVVIDRDKQTLGLPGVPSISLIRILPV